MNILLIVMGKSGTFPFFFHCMKNRIYTMSKAFVKVLPSRLYNY